MLQRDIALNYIYLSKNHAGGKDQVGINLLKGFQEIDFAKRIVVICYDHSQELIKRIAPDVEVVSIPAKDESSELVRMARISHFNTFRLNNILKEHDIKLVYHLSCNTGFSKTEAESIVIPHDIKAIAHRVLAGVKVPIHKYLIYKIMYKADFRTNDHIIAISDTDKSEISQYYPEYKDKIQRIYNPIDVRRDDKEPEERGNYIASLNLQFHHKNIITLIKAFALIKDEISEDLVLIGSVPDRVKYLKDYVAEHNLQDRIRFTGFVSDEEKDKLFRNCKLYVNPTLYEGFGMTAVEAMIHKIPTLVSKIPANYEITQHLAWYYEPAEDEKALATAIKKAIKAEWEDADRKSEQIYNSYNYTKIAEEYKAFFERCIS
ncbi:Glycosyltransferase involved in cell wall bisynthesis [Oscillospiraceae bacterium]|nr:Glycosyltransferase involved in cell wall bisynthesis [Oscillospiraceae bacterium]